ncbi:MAG TPA: sulfatase-like hydrolase/transferase, partial [Hyphomonadaceae bacterium]|nr:sulfatase-like hydrolase/transferase [Hyphomonadaceae bacterium]
YGPRGVMHCWADGKGGQKIENTGPLTKKRMEKVDEEFLAAAKKFIKASVDAGEPFFVWFNTTHMHFRTHAKPESLGQSGRWQSEYHDVMIDHDKNIGEMIDLLDELGIADNTFVMYSTDNGPHQNSWPDAGTTPFRSEKNTNWEGAYRVPALIRFPGRIEAGSTCNGIVSHHDWFPTLAKWAGVDDVKGDLKKGAMLDGHRYKVCIDGYDLTDYLTGETDENPRPGFVYFNDDSDVVGIRYDNWKIVFLEQRCKGTMQIWAEPFTPLRVPKIFNLRTDPLERADITSNTYYDWLLNHVFLLVPAQAMVGEFLQTFVEFPPRQKAASFSIDQVVAKIDEAMTAGH